MTYQDLKQSIDCAENIPRFFFFLGYKQVELPRLFRKLIARTEIHKAWLSGITGAWLYSVLDREKELKCTAKHELDY
jgi:hypothetical protein